MPPWCEIWRSNGTDFSVWETNFWLRLLQIEVNQRREPGGRLRDAFGSLGFLPLAQTQDRANGDAPVNAEDILMELLNNINEPDNISGEDLNMTDEDLNVIKDSHSALLSLLAWGNAAPSEREQLTNPS